MTFYHVGELTEKITIKREAATADGQGGEVMAYVTRCQPFAKVIAGGGSEKEEHDRNRAAASVTFVIRYRDDILTTDVITWNGTDYNIRLPRYQKTRAQWLEIEAERGVTI